MSKTKKAIAPLGMNFCLAGTLIYPEPIFAVVVGEVSPWFSSSIIVVLIQGQNYPAEYDLIMTYGMLSR